MEIDFERLLPNRPEDTDMQLVEFGQPGYPALIVDSFYRDPDHVRAFAMALRYKVPLSSQPGHVAAASMDLGPLVAFAYEHIGHWYFQSPQAMQSGGGACQFFRTECVDGEPVRPLPQRPHADHALLNGLIYLNKPEQCCGGTSFFRHHPTGAEALFPRELMSGRCPDGRFAQSWMPDAAVKERMWRHGAQRGFERACEAGLASSYDAYWELVTNAPGAQAGPILGSCGEWELTRVIEMKYNRLVLFPGFLLHSDHFEPGRFGDGPETWRMTQTCVFNWPATAKQG